MNKTLFIADLHLSADRDDITTCFTEFLSDLSTEIDALYILGDLFEVWLGDDDINPFTSKIERALSGVSERGISVYFIHGNRDFLLREKFAARAKMTLLPERLVIDLYGTPTLIMHGDELCTQDIAYQNFRKKARGWWWPKLVLSLPLFIRRRIAKHGRAVSQKNQQALSQTIMDVTPSEVQAVMTEFQVKRLIHGHTHRPAVHRFNLNNDEATRIVLGDWYEQGSVLEVTAEHAKLTNIPFISETQCQATQNS